jgi:internalin A
VTHRARVQREAVAAIQAAGGRVFYDWDVTYVRNPTLGPVPRMNPSGRPRWPKWLVDRLGVDYFGDVRMVLSLGRRDTDAVVAHVGRLGRLASLSFTETGDPLTDAGLAHLRGSTELGSIVFGRNPRLTRSGFENLKSLHRLERLACDFLPLTDDDLIPLGHLKSLVSMRTGSPRITDAGLSHLSGLVNLRDLHLDDAQVTGAGLRHLRRMTGLKALYLSRTHVETLEPMRELAGLMVLSLDGTPIDDAGLGQARGLARLTLLNLDGTRVTDAGLARLANLPRLEVLSLGNTDVTGPGLARLAALPALNSLRLHGTRINDAGLAHLAGFTSLTILDLADTDVTDAGLARLTGLKNLTNLRLGGTGVTDAGVAAFMVARPGVRVSRWSAGTTRGSRPAGAAGTAKSGIGPPR